jgi:hypothetical protein
MPNYKAQMAKENMTLKNELHGSESKETKHWLRIIAKANQGRRDKCQKLLREAQELSLIFSSILLSKK